ncbi:multidrug ABC transporter ATP-binding protein [Herbaspirillum sp. BH-1]|uniref:ABC-type multidrug transport system ATPase subunit n=1 Tax=Herbaspirillum frisingense TaxID=92645 RepID=A0ABU1P9G7_9BURK|nr:MULTISPECIES: ABC transporter ATP-binding protein [Herbaspirillum]MDR6582567.1 ABC-type multidrug transport system ATPase subunit [Herbaspirillum frisingense]PLY59730.1 multidrug ABC transporter ATP-binding protein [Herbaspirillum sp. BH-1]
MSDQPGLRIRGLSKTYPNGVKALAGVDLDVAPGLYGLLGPNGAGKSSLMRTLATLQRPDSGSIALDGVDVLAHPDRLRQRLGYLPQTIGAYPGVSGRSLLERFAWLKGRTDGRQRKAEVAMLLERVNLSEAAQRPVESYSGGMLRRFGIAMALIGSPRLLIVDEPTAGLDPAERNRFHRVLADVAAEAVVLLSTHIVEDIENLCDRLAILAGGRIVAEGAPTALCAPLQGRLWARRIGRGQAVPAALLLTAVPGGTLAVVQADTAPGPDYLPQVPTLEHAYYAALQAAGLHGQEH